VDEARLTAENLLAHVLDQDRFRLYLQPDLALTEAQNQSFRDLVSRRSQGIPVQHLLGSVSFMGLDIKVNGDVLIPRFETEELVEKTLRRLPDRAARFLDAGTGSGAIAISLIKLRPDINGVAVDISDPALNVARENAATHNVIEQIQFLSSDWLNSVEGCFDVIVSNPPYIATADIQTLAPVVRDHDPHQALDGGTDGLESIRILADQAKKHLSANGWLLIEVGEGQTEDVQKILASVGYRAISVYPDLSGIERIVEAQWEDDACRG
jgi:release factor glutamine methyltransferase